MAGRRRTAIRSILAEHFFDLSYRRVDAHRHRPPFTLAPPFIHADVSWTLRAPFRILVFRAVGRATRHKYIPSTDWATFDAEWFSAVKHSLDTLSQSLECAGPANHQSSWNEEVKRRGRPYGSAQLLQIGNGLDIIQVHVQRVRQHVLVSILVLYLSRDGWCWR